MKEHTFKEFYFQVDGMLNGRRTCIQQYKCVECGETIELPMSVLPTDYFNGYCQGGKNEHSDKAVRLVSHGKWLSPNRKSGRPGGRV